MTVPSMSMEGTGTLSSEDDRGVAVSGDPVLEVPAHGPGQHGAFDVGAEADQVGRGGVPMVDADDVLLGQPRSFSVRSRQASVGSMSLKVKTWKPAMLLSGCPRRGTRPVMIPLGL